MWQFKHPWSCIIAGLSNSGKTQLLIRIIKQRDLVFDTKFHEIIWCYREVGAIPRDLKNERIIRFVQGVPSHNDIVSDGDVSKPRLVILDDLQRESSKNDAVVDLFTRGSHHKNISVFAILQNIFNSGKNKREMSINASYIIYMKSPRGKTQIFYLARQLLPEDPKVVIEAYNDSTSKPFGYLHIDLKQNTPDSQRLCTNILPDEGFTFCCDRRYK
jgi:hypothetical protein